jgi:hypothetical protein
MRWLADIRCLSCKIFYFKKCLLHNMFQILELAPLVQQSPFICKALVNVSLPYRLTLEMRWLNYLESLTHGVNRDRAVSNSVKCFPHPTPHKKLKDDPTQNPHRPHTKTTHKTHTDPTQKHTTDPHKSHTIPTATQHCYIHRPLPADPCILPRQIARLLHGRTFSYSSCISCYGHESRGKRSSPAK